MSRPTDRTLSVAPWRHRTVVGALGGSLFAVMLGGWGAWGSSLVSVSSTSLQMTAHGMQTLEGDAFSGVEVTYGEDVNGERVVIERARFVDGKREGLRVRWYADGVLQSRQSYVRGRLHGLSDSFWPDGGRRSRSEHKAGRLHGVSAQWYREGMMFKRRTLVDGQEHGRQQAWRRNGSLYANYEAIGGRNYGLNKAELCFQVGTP